MDYFLCVVQLKDKAYPDKLCGKTTVAVVTETGVVEWKNEFLDLLAPVEIIDWHDLGLRSFKPMKGWPFLRTTDCDDLDEMECLLWLANKKSYCGGTIWQDDDRQVRKPDTMTLSNTELKAAVCRHLMKTYKEDTGIDLCQ